MFTERNNKNSMMMTKPQLPNRPAQNVFKEAALLQDESILNGFVFGSDPAMITKDSIPPV